MMGDAKKIFFLALVFSGSQAALINQASYGDVELKYYNEFDDSVNYAGALTRCWQRGGWLVMPKNNNINSAVQALIGTGATWIGLGDFGVEGAYEFIDGSNMEWTNWNDGEPNNYEDQDCMKMIHTGRWYDDPCQFYRGYVCHIPNTRSLAYDHSQLTAYKTVEATTYQAALAACEQFGSRLVKVTNDHHAQKLLEQFPQLASTGFWVGNRDSDQCPSISSGGKGEGDCDRKKPFICEAVEPHKVVVSDEAPEVPKSSDLEIHCSAYGFPTPDVTWFHNNMEIDDQVKRKGHSTMKLNDVTSSDDGPYVCRATNMIRNKAHKMEGYSFVKVVDEAE